MDIHFYQRDKNAVEYSKSVLDQGDTLVLIKYPNDKPAYDATGFPLSNLHRVHSANLLATGSEVFKFLLNNEWLNHRAAKRAGVFPGLPDGIKYVIDLTPPEEGDDALQLTADLSCSAGIRNWHTAQSRLQIAHSLIGGKDETTTRQSAISQPTSPTRSADRDRSGASELSNAVTSIINGEKSGNSYLGVLPDTKYASKEDDAAVPEHCDSQDKVRNQLHFEEESRKDDSTAATSDGKASEHRDDDEVLDYCPIRHRACIERLLQVVEGKDPRLDSAPKVWTLAFLAKYFDCSSTVVDYIFTWIIAEPNIRFIETLPEATLKMGIALKNPTLTRHAYSILVSEEALRVGDGKYFKEFSRGDKWIGQTENYGKDVTRFGRVREDLDEDILNSIQHAGRNFSARIESALGELLDREVTWFLNIPEFTKLAAFKEYLIAATGPDSPEELRYKRQAVVDLIDGLGCFVRGKVLYCLLTNLTYAQSKTGTDHRNAENWQGQPHGGFFDADYNTLTDHERMVTRGFWELLRNLEWTAKGGFADSNQIREGFALNNPYHKYSDEIADKHGIKQVEIRYLKNRCDSLNMYITAAIRNGGFNDGKMPLDVPSSSGAAQSVVDGITGRLTDLDSDSEDDSSMKGFWARDSPPVKSAWAKLIYEDAGEKSPLFYLPIFLHQVGQRLRSLCNNMLSRGENDWSVLCDTLLSLSDDEYKYLPLWAGGMDDGSGGVFEEEIPPAEKGPIGPGPAFHTGSTANSMVDSDFDFDVRSSVFGSATMEGIQTSLGVEDGFSERLDRRVVYSEEDFPMDHGALPVDSHARDGHAGSGLSGPAQQGGGSAGVSAAALGDTTQDMEAHSAGVSSSGHSHIDGDDFFNVLNDDEDLDMDSGSDGTLTETE